MEHRLHHIHIKSKDPRASAQWWLDMFGGTPLPELSFGTMLFVPVDFDGARINFTNSAPGEDDVIADPPAIPHYALEHLGILTDDLDADLAKFEEQGLTVFERRPGAGGMEIAFVETPDGVCLELMMAPR